MEFLRELIANPGFWGFIGAVSGGLFTYLAQSKAAKSTNERENKRIVIDELTGLLDTVSKLKYLRMQIVTGIAAKSDEVHSHICKSGLLVNRINVRSNGILPKRNRRN